MTQVEERRRVVRVLAKGQITIPAEFREALGIEQQTVLSISLVGDHLELTPLHPQTQLRDYTDEELDRFLEEDRIDVDTVEKIRALLRQERL